MRTPFLNKTLSDGEAATRCNRLLMMIVALLATQPLVDGTAGRIIVGLVFVGVFCQAAVALSDQPRNRLIVRMLASASTLVMIAHVTQPFEDGASYIFVPFVLSVFGAYVSWTLLGFVVRGQSDANTRLSAALCVYLLAGFAWSMAYLALFLADPASFSGAPIEALAANTEVPVPGEAFKVFTYFSYVTLTTLGYGDITPVSGGARTLVMLEAVGGVLYLAVMVASLVGSRDERS